MIKLDLSKKEMENLTQDEIELAKARKLEILILPYLKRNIKFFYAGGNLTQKREAYRTELNKKELEERMKNKGNSISTACRPLCEMVVGILKENGINAETVSCDTDIFKHVDVLITATSGKKYIINYLEDIANIQTGMNTPYFASYGYYTRRYEKFSGGLTTDNKSLKGLSFIDAERLNIIDQNLGYKQNKMYMDDVIAQIRKEFSDFRNIMAENEFLTLQKNNSKKSREEVYKKWISMSENQILEKKLDWIFNYFNSRMDIEGHTDFVMYYSRLLLKEVLTKDEYEKVERYDCYINRDKTPRSHKITNILDLDNDESASRARFCLIKLNNVTYAFSTKPNAYEKLNEKEFGELYGFARINKVSRPTDLAINLQNKGNACPILFHPLGSRIVDERDGLIDSKLSEDERKTEVERIANQIKATDGEITSLTIP